MVGAWAGCGDVACNVSTGGELASIGMGRVCEGEYAKGFTPRMDVAPFQGLVAWVAHEESCE